MQKNLILISFILIYLLSCKSKTIPDSRNEINENNISIILFSIQKNDNKQFSIIKLVRSYNVVGELKKARGVLDLSKTENYITVYMGFDSTIVTHPLYKQIEYLDMNNNLQKKDTLLSDAEFFIRIQNKEIQSSIKVKETIKNKSVKITDFNL